jgi:hypothetical protein
MPKRREMNVDHVEARVFACTVSLGVTTQERLFHVKYQVMDRLPPLYMNRCYYINNFVSHLALPPCGRPPEGYKFLINEELSSGVWSSEGRSGARL